MVSESLIVDGLIRARPQHGVFGEEHGLAGAVDAPKSKLKLGKVLDKLRDEARIESLLDLSVRSLWVGTYNGLQRFRASRFQSLTAADGLPSDLAFTILEDTAPALTAFG